MFARFHWMVSQVCWPCIQCTLFIPLPPNPINQLNYATPIMPMNRWLSLSEFNCLVGRFLLPKRFAITSLASTDRDVANFDHLLVQLWIHDSLHKSSPIGTIPRVRCRGPRRRLSAHSCAQIQARYMLPCPR